MNMQSLQLCAQTYYRHNALCTHDDDNRLLRTQAHELGISCKLMPSVFSHQVLGSHTLNVGFRAQASRSLVTSFLENISTKCELSGFFVARVMSPYYLTLILT